MYIFIRSYQVKSVCSCYISSYEASFYSLDLIRFRSLLRDLIRWTQVCFPLALGLV